MKNKTFKNLKEDFEKEQEKHYELGAYINLATVIIGKEYNKNIIKKAFLELIPRDEYDFNERKPYILHLSNM